MGTLRHYKATLCEEEGEHYFIEFGAVKLQRGRAKRKLSRYCRRDGVPVVLYLFKLTLMVGQEL